MNFKLIVVYLYGFHDKVINGSCYLDLGTTNNLCDNITHRCVGLFACCLPVSHRIPVYIYIEVKGEILGLKYIDSCKTTLKFSNHYTSLTLIYYGTALYDSSGSTCEAEVEIRHISYTNVNICVQLNYGYDMCRESFRFYYAENPYQYYTCDQIQDKPVCQRSEKMIAEFKPWEYTGRDISINVYKQSHIERKKEKNQGGVYGGVIVGIIVVVIVMVFAIVHTKRIATNTGGQPVNQPRAELTRYHSQEGYQCPVNSAEPPNYDDVMAAENRENIPSSTGNGVTTAQNRENNPNSTGNYQTVDTTDENGPQECQRSQEDSIEPSAPTPYDGTVPEEPPPPYPGYS